jgi:predicted phage terminase large subunit-like protein
VTSASEELARRRRIRGSLEELSKLCELTPAAHHKYIMKHLEQVSQGALNRLLISAPPGSAKSTVASVLFPVFFLANHPDAQLIACSHTVELAEKFGRRVRNLISEHSAVLGLQLSDDSQSAGSWSLKSGGGQFCVGSSGALSGRRADCVILDDIFRSMDDAYSESTRRGISDWFYGEVLPRLRPGGKVVGIGTRYHNQELFAELEASGRYKVIKLTAVAEEGDELGRPVGTYLWADQPDTYPFAGFLQQQQEVLPPRIWASQFMCKPSPTEGAFFRASWLKTYHNLPPRENLKTYIAVDFAVTESVKADFTAIVVFGLDPGSDVFVLHVWRRQCDAATSVDALLDTVRDWKPMCVVTEAGGLKNAIGPFLNERMRQRHIYAQIETIPSRHAKEIRAQSIAGRMATRGLFLPSEAPWLSDFVNEALAFPTTTDDQVDCLSLFGQLLDRLVPGREAVKKEPPKILSLDPAIPSTVTMDGLWRENDRHWRQSSRRI